MSMGLLILWEYCEVILAYHLFWALKPPNCTGPLLCIPVQSSVERNDHSGVKINKQTFLLSNIC